MNNISITISFPKTTVWRLKASAMIIRLATWVGGFGGVDFIEDECSECGLPFFEVCINDACVRQYKAKDG
jgi:hypothetical protein